jgi:hypothetical protein
MADGGGCDGAVAVVAWQQQQGQSTRRWGREREVVQGTDTSSVAVADGWRRMSDKRRVVRERTWWEREVCC